MCAASRTLATAQPLMAQRSPYVVPHRSKQMTRQTFPVSRHRQRQREVLERRLSSTVVVEFEYKKFVLKERDRSVPGAPTQMLVLLTVELPHLQLNL